MKDRTEKQQKKTNETKSWFSEEINKINNPLPRWAKKKERRQLTKLRNESGNITANSTETREIMSKYYEQLYTNKLGNIGKIDKLIETTKTAKTKS